MEAREKEIIQSYRRVQAFIEAHPVEPPQSYGDAKEALDDVIARLADHTSAQDFGRRVSKAEKRRQRDMMLKLRILHLNPIAGVAERELLHIPGIRQALRTPEPGLGVEKLIATAKAMKDAAALYQPVFLKNGLLPDFLDRLSEAVRELEATIGGHARVVGTHVGARAGIAQELRLGRRIVKQIHTKVREAFFGNEVVLARWRAARRVKQLPSSGPIDEGIGTVPVQLVPPPAKAA